MIASVVAAAALVRPTPATTVRPSTGEPTALASASTAVTTSVFMRGGPPDHQQGVEAARRASLAAVRRTDHRHQDL